MNCFDDILDSIEDMDSHKTSELIDHNLSESLYNKSGNLDLFTRAFEQMRALGNTKLLFSKKSAEVTDYPANYPLSYDQKVIKFKFAGNITKNHITLFFIFHDEHLINIYDVTDVKKKLGTVPIDDLQVLVYPLNDGECTTFVNL